MKRYESKEVKCPFYHSEDAQRICCEGVCAGSSLHLVFADRVHKSAYKQTFCCDIHACATCPLSALLNRKYEE